MQDVIVICEKDSQRADIERAVGRSYGAVYAAQGHLLRLAEPEEVNPAWKAWGYDVLIPPDGRYPNRVDESRVKRDKYARIAAALKGARTVFIATDCDREGQRIGCEILEHARFRGRVMRVMFTAQDPKTLQAAFAAAQPNERYANLDSAAVARQQADQIFNLSLTRAATQALRAPGSRDVIGIGRVKTATLAIVCRRELEIETFQPVGYFEIEATAVTAAGVLRLMHAPAPEGRIVDARVARAIETAARGYEGALKVQVEMRSKAPPRLLDLPAMQKKAGAWGWSAETTLRHLQALYDTHKLLTYPRAEARYLAESQIADVQPILDGLAALNAFAPVVPQAPVIRTGKAGHFCDKALEGVSHHAIIPNVNVIADAPRLYAALSPDERRVFDVVARTFLAAVSPDHIYEATTVTMEVPVAGDTASPRAFRARGSVPKSAGWRAVWGGEDEDAETADGDDAALPPVRDGTRALLDPVRTLAKTTTPPDRYNEGTLIDAMQNSWRFVPEGPLRERLKEAKGIGTPATRGTVIEGLKKQGQLVPSKKHIVPSPAGMALYRLLAEKTPALVDPGSTARMELRLDEVLTGKASVPDVIAEVAAEATRLIGTVRDCAGTTPAPTGPRIFLDVPFEDKDKASRLGARWDREGRRWYVPPGVDPGGFKRWMPKPAGAGARAVSAPLRRR